MQRTDHRPVCRERGERYKPHNHLQEYSSSTKSSKILLTLGLEISFQGIYMLGHNTQKLFLTQLIKSTTNKTLQAWSEMNLAILGLAFSRTLPSPASGLRQMILTWRDLAKNLRNPTWSLRRNRRVVFTVFTKTTLLAHNSSDHWVCVAAALKICKWDSIPKVTVMLSSQKLLVLHQKDERRILHRPTSVLLEILPFLVNCLCH